jgi:flagellar motility protein MotE (MotC chaperone)
MKLKGVLFLLLTFSLNAQESSTYRSSHRLELSVKAEQLKKWEKDLDKREKNLQKIGRNLKDQFEELSAKEEKIRQIFHEQNQHYENGLKQAEELVGLMNPEGAAAVVGGLSNELSASLIQKLPTRRAAPILEQLPPEKSQLIIERLSTLSQKTYGDVLESLGLCPLCECETNKIQQSKNQ